MHQQHSVLDDNAVIIWNKHIQSQYYSMGIRSNPLYLNAQPGQFLSVKDMNRDKPFLRRPFSIHQVIENTNAEVITEILYRVVGTCTENMSHMQAGQSLSVMGPLGNGFQVSSDMKQSCMVAGGVGIAPLVFLASWLIQNHRQLASGNIFIGGRSHTDVLCVTELKELGYSVVLTTEDGSMGIQGRITSPFELFLEQHTPDMIFACGPIPMLKAVAMIAIKKNIPCQVSLETVMACGLGACLGCAVSYQPENQTYLHVCREGAVFNAFELNWDTL
ncbi:MAG: dihydroorotate dehydrogenase electron transfer subunit [Desulfobacterales bacterium]|nr:dihydroorotate dehydrogenase electron transfer subunit [Desulfobacterales bacterium]